MTTGRGRRPKPGDLVIVGPIGDDNGLIHDGEPGLVIRPTDIQTDGEQIASYDWWVLWDGREIVLDEKDVTILE